MKLLIHDMSEEELRGILPSPDIESYNVVSPSPSRSIRNCIGCFGCWIKTPGACVIRDDYGDMGDLLSKTDEVLVISRCVYGGFSPFVKNVLDRSISYMHPDFEIRNGEMHHKRRYPHSFNWRVWFYGGNITESEKQTAEKIIKANSINLQCQVQELRFL